MKKIMIKFKEIKLFIQLLKSIKEYIKIHFYVYFFIKLLTQLKLFLYLFFVEQSFNYVSNLSSSKILINIPNYLIITVIIILISEVVSYLNNIYGDWIFMNINIKSSENLTNKVVSLEYEKYESNKHLNEIQRAKTSSTVIVELLNEQLALIMLIANILIYIIYIAKINIFIILGYGICIVLILLVSIRLGVHYFKLWDNVVDDESKTKYFYRLFVNKESDQDRRVFSSNLFFKKKWKEAYCNKEIIHQRMSILGIRLNIIPNILFAIISFVLLIYIYYQISKFRLEIGVFVSTLTVIIGIYTSIDSLSFSVSNLITISLKVNAFNTVLKYESNYKLNYDYNDFEEINISNVTYMYPGGNNFVINNINTTLRNNSIVALVGKNGSGKSTFVNMLAGLLEPTSGTITSKHYTTDSLKSINSIGMIEQKFPQYQLSIRENITFGNLSHSFSDQEIEGLLQKVGLLDEVKTLKDGIYSKIGEINEGGINLSKGQWQRIAICRLLANPNNKIWILDEPTAYIDPLGEVEIYKLIKELSSNKLVIFVSHRLGFCRFCDKIILIENGSIIEDGSFEELIKDNGEFCKMYNLQKKSYDDNQQNS